jgi:L-malate glycosyltransferase
MKRKILLFSDYPTIDGVIRGGIPRAVYNVFTELSTSYQEFEIHICSFSSKKSNTLRKNKNLFIHYYYLPFTDYPILIPNILIKLYVKKIINQIKPDLIHIQGISKAADAALQLNFFPIIITVHGIIFQESKFRTGILGHYHSYVGNKLENRILKLAKKIIAVSPYVKKEIEQKTTAEIQVIFNPIDPKFFDIKKYEVRNRILFVGGIEPRKGLHILVEAINFIKPIIPDVQVHIVGSVRKKDYFSKILHIINQNELDNLITFRGPLDETDLLEEYSQASIFVLPSKEESLGIVLLEAMATGTPIVASNIGGIPNIILDGENGFLFEYGDVQKLSELIVNLLLNDRQRNQIGNTGKIMAKEFHRKKIAREQKEYYDKIFITYI